MIQILTACLGLPSHYITITKPLNNLRLATKISICVAILRFFYFSKSKDCKESIGEGGVWN